MLWPPLYLFAPYSPGGKDSHGVKQGPSSWLVRVNVVEKRVKYAANSCLLFYSQSLCLIYIYIYIQVLSPEFGVNPF